MKRLVFSTLGVILTFIWIVYTAPASPDNPEITEHIRIKKISKSGSTSLNKISQPMYRSLQSDKLKKENLLVNSRSENLVMPINEKE